MRHRNISKLIKKRNTVKKNFKDRLIESFGVNPYICKNCGKDMILWEIWHYKYGLIYNALDKSNYKKNNLRRNYRKRNFFEYNNTNRIILKVY